MPPAAVSPTILARFKRLPQRTAEVWQGGIVRFPAWLDDPADPDGPPLRATGVIWVSLRTGLFHVALVEAGEEATPELALATLLDFGLKQAKALDGRPARIEVRDVALRDALAGPLAALETGVVVVEDQPAVRDALRAMEEEEEDSERIPGLLESPGMSVDRVRAFAEAAAACYAARPWDRLSSDDLIVVDSEGAPKDLRHLSVLGQGSEVFGLSFFDSRRDFDRLVEGLEAGREPTRANGVTFDAIDALPFADVDAWQDHRLPVAAPDAYPLIADLRVDGPARRPTARALSFAEGLLRALAATTDDELDAGAWQKHVETFDGPLELRLSLPLLLEAEAGRPRRHVPRQATPLERARALANDAMDTPGRLGLKLARQALAVSEDCADAWVVLAESTSDPEAALKLYERAVQAGAAAIGDEPFDALRGDFWGNVDTRPYMRARFGLAQVLAELERHAVAAAHYRALLELNPRDEQGVRYLLLIHLLHEEDDDEAGRLLAEYADDPDPLWPYGRLLWLYRTEGDTETARDAFASAVAANPQVVKYLLDPDAMFAAEQSAKPSSASRTTAPSSDLDAREAAADVADALLDPFESTDGALEWLAAQAARRRGSRVSSRSRSRHVH